MAQENGYGEGTDIATSETADLKTNGHKGVPTGHYGKPGGPHQNVWPSTILFTFMN